jgi:hypothetical protein
MIIPFRARCFCSDRASAPHTRETFDHSPSCPHERPLCSISWTDLTNSQAMCKFIAAKRACQAHQATSSKLTKQDKALDSRGVAWRGCIVSITPAPVRCIRAGIAVDRRRSIIWARQVVALVISLVIATSLRLRVARRRLTCVALVRRTLPASGRTTWNVLAIPALPARREQAWSSRRRATIVAG